MRVAKTKVLISFAGTREAGLLFCFRLGKNLVFSWRGSFNHYFNEPQNLIL